MKFCITLILLVSLCSASSYLSIIKECNTHILVLRNGKRSWYKNPQEYKDASGAFKKRHMKAFNQHGQEVEIAIETIARFFGDGFIREPDYNAYSHTFQYEERFQQAGYTLCVRLTLTSKASWLKRQILYILFMKSIKEQK